MRRVVLGIAIALALPAYISGRCQSAFTLQQVLSAPYATSLTSSPSGSRFAWVENAEGRTNLWAGGPAEPAHMLTHYTEDDGQDVSGIAWSPDGSTIAFVRGSEMGANGKPANPAELQPPPAVQVFVAAADGKSQPRLIDDGRAPLFSRDGHSLFFLKAGQIWAADLPANGSAAAHQLVYDRGSDSQLTLSPDGSLLAFVSRRDHDHSFVGVFDFHARSLRFMGPSTGNDSAPCFSPDGKVLAWIREPFTDVPEFAANRTSANPWSIQIAALNEDSAHTIFAAEPNKPGSVIPHLSTGQPRLFWGAGNRLIFASERDGWIHLYAVDATHPGEADLLTPGEFEVEDATLSIDRRTLLYASNQLPAVDAKSAQQIAAGKFDSSDTERRHLWQLDLTQAHPKPQAITHGAGIETHPQISANGKAYAALISDVRTPMHAAMVAADGMISDLHPGAVPISYPAKSLVEPQPVFFLSADRSHKLHGQLFLPKAYRQGDIAKRPTILFFHGGPRRQMLLGYPAMDYYSNAYAMNQYLVSRGFIVLSVNYRCGIGYGMEFRQCEHSGADGAAEYNDVLGAAAYLRSRPDVDTKRIGVWGGSYGGYLTALALARNSDMFAAGVDFHGVHDWILEDNRADWLRGTNAEKDVITVRAHASSPMADIDRWRSPVLLIHGDNDPEVAYRQTPTLAEALRARRVPVEELIFPDEVHGFLLHRDWLKAYEASAAFFEHVLLPEQTSAAKQQLNR